MIRSMTGFGKSTTEIPGKKITVEIRSLNSKQLDISSRIPWVYKEKEIEMREIINRALDRGKIDFSIFVDVIDDSNAPTINKALVKNYYRQLKEVAGDLYIDADDQLLSIIMRLPETLRTEKETMSEEEWTTLSALISEALEMVDNYRADEGKSIEKDLKERISNISRMLEEIEPFEKSRVDNIRERILNNLASLGTEGTDMSRFEQELLFYLEKLDINEEKVRLTKHCEYFLETMALEGANGKKLGFISQEIGREINTIGSKSNDAAMQGIVVRMKDELEKIKEQVLNVL
ncbi:MAG: YicC/YloC family endoribonuclease [Bacteroidales bacterium]